MVVRLGNANTIGQITGTGAGEPTPPPDVESGGGSGSGTSGDPDESQYEWADGSPRCGTFVCNHVVGAIDLEWVGCPPRIFWSDPTGPHGPEVWSMRLVDTHFDMLAMTEVGFYKGTSIINGFVYTQAFARNTCDVGFVIFQGMHQ